MMTDAFLSLFILFSDLFILHRAMYDGKIMGKQ